MASLNRVQLIGHLGRDPEMRYTPKGTPSTRFSVAVNHTWTNAEGQNDKKEPTGSTSTPGASWGRFASST